MWKLFKRDGLPHLLPVGRGSASSDGGKDLRMIPHPLSWRKRQGSPVVPPLWGTARRGDVQGSWKY